MEQSYSPIALFAIPIAATILVFLLKAGKWPFIQKWLGASAISATFYVIGSTLIEGPSALVGVAFVFALIVQMPVSMVVGGLMTVLGRLQKDRS